MRSFLVFSCTCALYRFLSVGREVHFFGARGWRGGGSLCHNHRQLVIDWLTALWVSNVFYCPSDVQHAGNSRWLMRNTRRNWTLRQKVTQLAVDFPFIWFFFFFFLPKCHSFVLQDHVFLDNFKQTIAWVERLNAIKKWSRTSMAEARVLNWIINGGTQKNSGEATGGIVETWRRPDLYSDAVVILCCWNMLSESGHCPICKEPFHFSNEYLTEKPRSMSLWNSIAKTAMSH